MIFGMDVSRWNGGDVDFHRARREGIEFAILRSWDRDANEVDRTFHRNLRVARDAGMIVAAYHFIVPWEDGWTNADHVLRHVPAELPVILDVEKDKSGRGTSIGLARDVAHRLRASGRRLPLAYVPRWYWKEIGLPDLRGLGDHGLWASQYATRTYGTPAEIYPHLNPKDGGGWDPYGGCPVRILQFTDDSTIAGQAPRDANAFLGTREELAQLLGEDDMYDAEYAEKMALIESQFTTPWPSFVQDGGDHEWGTYLFATDHDSFRNWEKAAGVLGKLQATRVEQASGAEFDREAYLARVKESSKQKAAAEVYEVNVEIGREETA
ncbi:glycoside hydrolase family 25 protein [Saccharopolyspora mangrovi]|uniref:Glycoside hydrolase family 25 protein n=1 Tax=Saccharopolyspora mangrovi TaxID=3082379 RepID=A0ABU6A7G4_9PSEU|nr:glycoside hydrolase family 25 protein [Saccharopolyspora sp. S2-29]MEB3367426.1 glycoside hydrolase family 25 protein [Saccharopolyspora sp. S2-29]